MTDAEVRVRVDKWLWAARFFKSRSRATEAVEGGKVRLNSERPRPAKTLSIGDRIQVRVGLIEYEIEVRALSLRRGPASQARLLYAESEDSCRRRDELLQQLKSEPHIASQQRGRPTKRDRRKLSRVLGALDQNLE
jgi:ribosome-associated heat shock protein Hsp15